MSLAYATACPLLLAEDRLRLHPQFYIHNRAITDSLLGAQHSLSPKGYRLGKQLENGISYKDLLASSDRAAIRRSELIELLGFLNKHGALIQERTIHTALRARAKVALSALIGVRYEPVSRRFTASALQLVWAVLRACRIPILLSLLLGIPLSIGVASATWHTLAIIGAGMSVFLTSIYIHELCHVLLTRAQTQQIAIVQSGMRVGVLHATLPNALELRSAISGPLTGALYALLLGLLAGAFSQYVIVALCFLVCCLHLCGLLPWYGDGAAVATILKRRKL